MLNINDNFFHKALSLNVYIKQYSSNGPANGATSRFRAGCYALPRDPSEDENPSTPEDLKVFAIEFKRRRMNLGVSLRDVALAVSDLSGISCYHPAISRFEALQLQPKNMSKLKPFLIKWLEKAESAPVSHRKPKRSPKDSSFSCSSASRPIKKENEGEILGTWKILFY